MTPAGHCWSPHTVTPVGITKLNYISIMNQLPLQVSGDQKVISFYTPTLPEEKKTCSFPPPGGSEASCVALGVACGAV